MKKKIIIQLNEANFDIIEKYTKKYKLKNFEKVFNFSFKNYTSSEKNYEDLEPWIQWYSFYTEKKYDEHKVFHLNDSLKKKLPVFLERLIKNNKKVGIFSSMNLPPNDGYEVYIPDPWSTAKTDDSFESKIINTTIKQLVNNNSILKIQPLSILGIFFMFGIPSLNLLYLYKDLFITLIKKKREKLASYFDFIYFRYALNRSLRKNLDFTMIFLNGLAHVQHHYLLNSEFVNSQNNPDWYLPEKYDAVLESLKIYDKLLGLILKKEKIFDIWIITGLSQKPYKKPEIYWRFNDHKKILSNFLQFDFEVNPLMTRDFEIILKKHENIKDLKLFLENCQVQIDKKFTMKAFGKIKITSKKSIFATFVLDSDFKELTLCYKDKKYILDKNEINFVAIKNGEHDEKGWFFNNNSNLSVDQKVNIWNLSKLVLLENYD